MSEPDSDPLSLGPTEIPTLPDAAFGMPANDREDDALPFADSWHVPAIDAANLRSAVAAKLFGSAAEPVKIGRFNVLRRIGAGGMGVVYAAYDEQLDRKVAVKVLHNLPSDPDLCARHNALLAKEAQALARLSHPNVVQVYEVGDFRGQVFVAMEFLTGQTLRQRQLRPHGRWSAFLAPWVAAAKGLAAAHSVGLAHRDFKPDNAMVAADGTVKVLDFGLAGDIEAPRVRTSPALAATGPVPTHAELWSTRDDVLSTHRTRSGQIMGTPAYMAPEQHLGQRADAQSDQFSFCVALWEAIYDQRPFAGQTLAELAANVIHDRRLPPPNFSRVPKWLARVLVRGLAREPAARFPSMQALIAELERDRDAFFRRIGLVAGGVAAASALWLAKATSHDPCETLASQDQAVWNESKAGRLAQAFERAGVSATSPGFSALSKRLTDYINQAQKQEANACQAALVDHEESVQAYGLRSACLARRIAAFSSLTEALIAGDAKVIKRSFEAVDELPPLTTCEDPNAAVEIKSLPASEHERITLQEIESLIAQAETQWALRIGNPELAPAQRALQLAIDLQHLDAQARAQLVLGHLHFLRNSYPESLEAFAQARQLADRVGNDTLRVSSYLGELNTLQTSGQLAQARALIANVQAALARAGHPREVQANFLVHLARLDSAQGQPCAALTNFTAALKLRQAIFGDRYHGIADLWRRMGRVYALELGRTHDAQRLFEQAYALLLREVGADHWLTLLAQEDRAWNLTEHARVLGQSDPHAAQAAMKQGLADFASLVANFQAKGQAATTRLAWTHHNYGRLLHRAGQLPQAEAMLQASLAAAVHPNRAVTSLALAQVHADQGASEQARQELETVLGALADPNMASHRAEAAFALGRLLAKSRSTADQSRARQLLGEARTTWQGQREVQGQAQACLGVSQERVLPEVELAELDAWERTHLAPAIRSNLQVP